MKKLILFLSFLVLICFSKLNAQTMSLRAEITPDSTLNSWQTLEVYNKTMLALINGEPADKLIEDDKGGALLFFKGCTASLDKESFNTYCVLRKKWNEQNCVKNYNYYSSNSTQERW